MRVTLALLLLLLNACSPHHIREFEISSDLLPKKFYAASKAEEGALSEAARPWWFEIGSRELNEQLNAALKKNFSLESSFQRLIAAQATASELGADRFPQLDLGAVASRQRTRVVGDSSFFNINGSINNFAATSGLSFEIDIWRRASSQAASGRESALANKALFESAILTLSGSVFENWVSSQEQARLLELLSEQQRASQEFLELTELRFSLGRGNALNVFQQRQQLASLERDIPLTKASLERLHYQRASLYGRTRSSTPESIEELRSRDDWQGFLPRPVDLLSLRPDLRAAAHELQASEYNLAVAFAERFPRLSVGLSTDFSAEALGDLFVRKFGVGDIRALIPLIDGGRRRARVRRSDAEVKRLFADFSQAYLDALSEVESLISEEELFAERLRLTEQQVQYATNTLNEAKSRYVNGLSEYLDVLDALQSKQLLERQLVSEEAQYLVLQGRLLRATRGLKIENLPFEKEKV